MMRFHHLSGLLCLLLTVACTNKTRTKMTATGDSLVERILRSRPALFQDVLDNAEKYRLQILYTQIDRDLDNRPHFRSHGYRLTKDNYFYPASTVKLPVVALALEKLNKINLKGLDKFTSLRIDSAYAGQTSVTVDSTSESGLPCIAHYIRKILLVSDNDAYNRLYEFLGQKYLNETLWQKGFSDARIIRRLESGASSDENRVTNPFVFYDADTVLYRQPLAINPEHYEIKMRNVKQGRGHWRSGRLLPEPIDFSHSNYISLKSLQGLLLAIIFPEAVPEQQRFHLKPEDYHFLYTYMSMLPRESRIASYADTIEYHDSYMKYFMFGDTRKPMPAYIRIFNKVGQAYGYLLDNAYIVDFNKKIEFFLTAVIQVNDNQIYNDNHYEYDTIGFPFLADLGRVIYDYELNRPRQQRPDLSKFKIEY